MGIDFTVENLSKSQPNAAPYLPPFHHPHTYDFASPLRECNIAYESFGMTLADRAPVSAHHRENALEPTRRWGCGLLLNPKSIKTPQPPLAVPSPCRAFLCSGESGKNRRVEIEQRAGVVVFLGILGTLLGVLLRRRSAWRGRCR
jgi:hypothetical protein